MFLDIVLNWEIKVVFFREGRQFGTSESQGVGITIKFRETLNGG